MIAITGATGQLGQLVTHHLLSKVPAASLVAVVRNAAKAADLAARGIHVRQADYSDASALEKAFSGVDKVLLISSSEVGQRVSQHRNIIEAAERAGVKFIAYTSLLHADTSALALAPEHVATESLIKASGLPFILLRNGWYSENYTAAIPGALAHNAFVGSAGSGKISSAARNDYAEAAAVVLTTPQTAGRVYELAGDTAYTLADLAAELSRQSGKTIPYVDLSEADYHALLIKAGLPAGLAGVLADSDARAAQGALFDGSRQLSQLIGRSTTPLTESIKQVLKS